MPRRVPAQLVRGWRFHARVRAGWTRSAPALRVVGERGVVKYGGARGRVDIWLDAEPGPDEFVEVAVDVPADLPGTSLHVEPLVRWELEVSGRTRWDGAEMFVVPVYALLPASEPTPQAAWISVNFRPPRASIEDMCKHLAVAAALATLVLAAACGSRGRVIYGPPFPADAYYAAPDVAPRPAADELSSVEADSTRTAATLAASDLMFVGRVVHVAKSPGVWSGIAVVHQAVQYHVETVLKGRAPDSDVVVHHMIVGPPMTEATEPRLSRAVWREGATLVVAASYATAPGAEFHPGGHGLLWLVGTIDPVAADGAAAERMRALVR